MLMYSKDHTVCFKHSNFFTVKVARLLFDIKSMTTEYSHPMICRLQHIHNVHVPIQQIRNPTTSFLTATTLIYAIGAGITAAAGTRLALQWILVKGFKLFSFQLPDLKKPGIVIFCHYLPVSGLGNLRACCLPWMW